MVWVCIGGAIFALVMGFFCGKKYFYYWWTEDATDIITRYHDDDSRKLRAVTVYYDKTLFLSDNEKLGFGIKTNGKEN